MLRQHCSIQCRPSVGRADEERLFARMIELSRQYSRHGYSRVAAMLRNAGWRVNYKRVKRKWRRDGMITKASHIPMAFWTT